MIETSPKEKNRYSSEELKEFEAIILKKIEKAEKEYEDLQRTIQENRTSSSESGVIKVDDSSEVAERETLSDLAKRQEKFINKLEKALERIKLGTYGVCRATGKLIKKERLRVVPHATLSLEAKERQ